MATGQQNVAKGVDELEKEMKASSKGPLKPKITTSLGNLRSALQKDNLQEISRHVTALKDALGKNHIQISDEGWEWLTKVQNRLHKETEQSSSGVSSDMSVKGQKVGDRPRRNIEVQPLKNATQEQTAVPEVSGKEKAPSTHAEKGQQSGENPSQNKTKDVRGVKERELPNPDIKIQKGDNQEPYVTKFTVKQENFAKTMPLPAKQPDRDVKERKLSDPDIKSQTRDQLEHNSDCEKLQKETASLTDKLNERQKELDDTHNNLQKKADEIKRIQSEYEEREKIYERTVEDERNKGKQLKEELSKKQNDFTTLEQQLQNEQKHINLLEEQTREIIQSKSDLLHKYQDEKRKYKQKTEDMEIQIQNLLDTIDKLTVEKNDLSRRYSEVASAKLKDNNPNIVDLSDPNRAMKLGERYGQLYNDAWTDAYEAQQSLGVSDRDGIQNLLDVLKESYKFCDQLACQQLEGLSNLLLYPYQDPEQQVSQMKGGIDKPRIASSNKKALLDLRRQVVTVDGVKQAFLSQMHKRMKSDQEKKVMDVSKAYYVKCIEICWLMVLHDPPLYMLMDVKPETKVDLNLYSVLSKGDKVAHLVWPPLLNGKDGGLLQKGVVEVLKGGNKKVSKPK